jgi:dGTPase
MDWNKLFSTQRLHQSTRTNESNDRSSYERDFDRVVFSSAFRRLQDKTQVIPLPESDFVHSRLTHSLEVSCVGRSLGKIIGAKVIEEYDLKHITAFDFGDVIAAACLAHDIGNPPFGHSGEGAISDYFKNGNGKHFKDQIRDDEKWEDLTNFEGNANGFRLLTNSNSASGGGAQLTYTTLATFTKYPCKSLKEKDSQLAERASQKKYGYFFAEREHFAKIFDSLEIRKLSDGNWCRHPLAFLVEAADDICYRIIDFEDGVRIGLIPFQLAEEMLKSILPPDIKLNKYELIKDEKEKMGYLRAKVIYFLIYEATDLFWANEKQILSGEYDKHLAEEIRSIDKLNAIRDVSITKVYNSRLVLQIEASGFNVVAELLDMFITAVNDSCKYGKKTKKEKMLSWKLVQLLPKQFLGEEEKPDEDLYVRILQICEFIAGMTDTYAITLYKRLKGIELPHD